MKILQIDYNKKSILPTIKQKLSLTKPQNKGLFVPIDTVVIDGHKENVYNTPIFDLIKLVNNAIDFLKTSEDEIAKTIRTKITGSADSYDFHIQLFGNNRGIVGGKNAKEMKEYSDKLSQKYPKKGLSHTLCKSTMVDEKIGKIYKNQKNKPKINLYGTMLNENGEESNNVKFTQMELLD